jgi:NADPH:quinone reductase-like Zn-dependent oxidoreductase
MIIYVQTTHIEVSMKAAIVREAGKPPFYGDFPEPTSASNERLIHVTATAISQVAKSRAAGSHYSSIGQFPFIAGVDGVGRLEDGSRVYFALPRTPYGSMAERTTVSASQCLRLPDELDDVTAAAIANPGMSSWAAYRERAKLKRGETVLVNGATGAAGRLAVQVARHLGAKKVIATGRDAQALRCVAELGADVTVALIEDDDALEERFKEQFAAGVDIVIDYLWGRTAERLLLAAAKVGEDGVPLRFVQIGSISGPNITLPSAVLRASAIEIMGSGLGSIPRDRFVGAIREFLDAAVPAGFAIATRAIPLSQVEEAWSWTDRTQRTVLTVG